MSENGECHNLGQHAIGVVCVHEKGDVRFNQH